MQVDFYQLGGLSPQAALPQLAARTLAIGERMLVVADDPALLAGLSEALWAQPGSFLAHGDAGNPHAARQPILLSATPEPANTARFIALADGLWREAALAFERVFLLFDAATLDAARATWRSLDGREGVARNYWRQDGGKWSKAA